MAIKVKVMGTMGLQEIEAETVGEIKELLALQNYTATVGGVPATNETCVKDGDIIALAEAIKGN